MRRLRRFIKVLYTEIRKKDSTSLRANIIRQLNVEQNIKNPDDIADQILRKESIIRYVYKTNQLFINNEPSTLYHIVNSTKKIEALVDAIHLTDCETVLDIGANTGLFSYFIKRRFPRAKVFMFEPDRSLWNIIKLNLKNFEDFEICERAVTNSDDEEVDFYINTTSAQTNSLIKEAVKMVADEEFILTNRIKTITIDSFCKANNLRKVDVMKIDIQGGELNALSGGIATLKSTSLLFAEISFIVDDTFEVLKLIKTFFRSYRAVNGVHMGADIKFYN